MNKQENCIYLVRNYDPETNKQNEVPSNVRRMNQQCDAILRASAQKDDVLSMEMINDIEWVVNCRGHPVKLTDDITMTITDVVRSNGGDHLEPVKRIRIRVSSVHKHTRELVQYVTKLYKDYNSSMQHDLTGHQYYFDQKYRNNERLDIRGNPHEDARMAKKHELNMAPKHLSFCKYQFRSNKSFSNLFGEEIDKIHNRVERFLNNKEWYEQKGVPYQLGICLSGTPGTGKTSCIGAIANMTGRHVINVNCANILTHTQLKRLFYEEDLHMYTDEDMANTIRLHIPIEHRIYVLEELDAIGKTLHQRDENHDGFEDEEPIYDQLTLGHWLQIFDDVNQVQGRIMVITTNHPEKLDKALLRPGRIDINVSLGQASRDTVAKMYQHFTETKLVQSKIAQLPDYTLSPAEVSNILQSNIDDPEQALADLTNTRTQNETNSSILQKTKPSRNKTQQQQKQPPAGVYSYNHMLGQPSASESYHSMFN